MADDDQDDDWVEPAAQVATNLLTTAANALGGTTAGAYAAAASPLVKRAFDSIGTRWRGLSDRGGQRVLEEAVEAGLPPGELEERIASTPERLMLAGAAISAGTRTVNEDKLRALGRSLAAGVSDDALVDQELLVTAALDDMEAPHLKVLRHVAEEHTATALSKKKRPVWQREVLASALPEVAAVLGPVLATLTRHHLLVEQDQTQAAMAQFEQSQKQDRRWRAQYGQESLGGARYKALPPLYSVTDFGEYMLELVRAADQDCDGGSAGVVPS